VASWKVMTKELSPRKISRKNGARSMRSAMAVCRNRPERTVRHGKIRRFSLSSQAAAKRVVIPSIPCIIFRSSVIRAAPAMGFRCAAGENNTAESFTSIILKVVFPPLIFVAAIPFFH